MPLVPAPIQTAFVTADIRASMRGLTETLGAGPWFLRERGVFAGQRYRGAPVRTELAIAMAYAGPMLYELIQQLDDGPSVYRDVVAARGYGLHHFGVAAEDFDAACGDYARAGCELVYEAVVAHGARVAYFDAGDRLPAMVEVIEMLPQARAMFDGFRRAHEGWDGADPVRPLAPVGSGVSG